jgi:perosamine synthetase
MITLESVPLAMPSLGKTELKYYLDAFESGWISSIGRYIGLTEELLASTFDSRYAVLTSSGTTALQLALASLGLSPGSKVILPNLTFIASASSIKHQGFEPFPVDTEADTPQLCPMMAKEILEQGGQAIMPVLLYGQFPDLETIDRLASEFGVPVILDAAEAPSANYQGRKVGNIGHVSVLSFYANKIITSGEGGCLLTNDPNIAKKAEYLRDHAMSSTKRYWHDCFGYNFRMTNMQASILYGQLERFDVIVSKRSELYNLYLEKLRPVHQLKTYALSNSASRNSPWLFFVELLAPIDHLRNDLIAFLHSKRIESRPYFYPLSQQPMFNQPDCLFPNSIRQSRTGINLPLFTDMTFKQVEYVCKSIKEFIDFQL